MTRETLSHTFTPFATAYGVDFHSIAQHRDGSHLFGIVVGRKYEYTLHVSGTGRSVRLSRSRR